MLAEDMVSPQTPENIEFSASGGFLMREIQKRFDLYRSSDYDIIFIDIMDPEVKNETITCFKINISSNACG